MATVPVAVPTQEPTMPQVTLGMRNALEKAQNYLDAMSFSREGPIRQLKYEKFTDDQIAYGILAVGY